MQKMGTSIKDTFQACEVFVGNIYNDVKAKFLSPVWLFL